jgi:GMC oxidoreductase
VPTPAPIFVPLAPEGRIILAAGALMSPRLLMLSGVGPFHLHDQIFDDGFTVPFHISNPGIGAGLFDHIATSVTYEYTGSTPPFQAYHYSDYAANAADLTLICVTRNVRAGRGRWCVLGFLLVLLALIPLAHASPPDPLWIAGVYDGGDFDDVILASTSVESRAEERVDTGHLVTPAVDLVVATDSGIPDSTPRAVRPRSPPEN